MNKRVDNIIISYILSVYIFKYILFLKRPAKISRSLRIYCYKLTPQFLVLIPIIFHNLYSNYLRPILQSLPSGLYLPYLFLRAH